MSYVETSDRFLRPEEIGRTPRNRRRVQIRRVLKIATNLVLIAGLVVGVAWAWQQMRKDARFIVKQVVIEGAVLTSRADIEAVTNHWVGDNLFRLDIDSLSSNLMTLSWVRSVAVEKRLPDTLVLHVEERVPVALTVSGGRIRYVDDSGTVFAELSTAVKQKDLPLITSADPSEMQRTVAFLESMKRANPELYLRLSEITPLRGSGFVLLDRALSARVYVDARDAASQWDALYRVAAAEGYGPGAIDYADLRFRGRVIVKPVVPRVRAPETEGVVAVRVSN